MVYFRVEEILHYQRSKISSAFAELREAAGRRFRPITLTAAAAVLAMIPLTRSVLWGPMAVAIMAGLVLATVLTILAVPAIYAAWYRVPRPIED